MKLLDNPTGYSPNSDGQFFHAVFIQAEEPEEAELLVMVLEDNPDVIWCHSPYRYTEDETGLPDTCLIMFYARRDMAADVPALAHEVEALIIGEATL